MDTIEKTRSIGSPLVRLALAAACVVTSVTPAFSQELKPEAVEGFQAFVEDAEAAMADRQNDTSPFLWLAEDPERLDEALDGQIVAKRLDTDVDLDGALIHNWIAGMFIPGATIDDVFAAFLDFDRAPDIYPEVVAGEFLGKDGDTYKLYRRLRKKRVVTVVVDTWQDAVYERLDENRAMSWTKSTLIREVKNPGQPNETLLQEGKDRGYIWRIYLYWRLEQRDGGVLAECRSISLSRSVPFFLKLFLNPFVRNVPGDSLKRSLTATRTTVQKAILSEQP